MRSKWKIAIWKDKEGNKVLRNVKVLRSFLSQRKDIHNGRQFVSMLVKNDMIGFKFGQFVVTKKLGSLIHSGKKLKNKLRSKAKLKPKVKTKAKGKSKRRK